MRRTLLAFCLSLLLAPSLALDAQRATETFLPTTNPRAVVQQRLAATEIEVRYHRPTKKGRQIFGALVPYGRVWRTGSDNATTIAFSTPVTFGGVAVPAGTYEIFSIPGEREWTVILHENRSQWGSYAYDSTHDVARVQVRPHTAAEVAESFTLAFETVTNSQAALVIGWDRVRVPVVLAVDVRATAVPVIEEALRTEGRKPYFLAAMFYYENDLDIDRAAELIGLALQGAPNHIGILHRQALILAKKGDTAGAIAAAERSLAGAQSSPPELKAEYTRLNTALLERLRRP